MMGLFSSPEPAESLVRQSADMQRRISQGNGTKFESGPTPFRQRGSRSSSE